jgi:hypothetical protein
MSNRETSKGPSGGNPRARRWQLSLDTWAVLLAFAAALAVRLGVLKHIPW